MANYSGPPFGGPFTYNAQYPPHPPGSYAMHQPPLYSPHRMPMYPQQMPHIVHPSQYANASAYAHNTQYPQAIPPGNGVHPPPHPAFYGYAQFPNAALPPPPYPPHPVAPQNYNMPPRISAPVSQVPSPGFFQPHSSLPQRPPSAPVEVHPVVTTDSPAVVSPDREDGELSEVDVQPKTNGSSSTGSHRSERGRKKIRMNQTTADHEHQTTLHAVTGSSELHQDREVEVAPSITFQMIPYALGDLKEHHVHLSSKARDHGYDQSNQPSSMTENMDPIQASSRDRHNIATAQGVEFEPNDKQFIAGNTHEGDTNITFANRKLNNKVDLPSEPSNLQTPKTSQIARGHQLLDMRGMARTALDDLHKNNIGFNELVAEGMDASVLGELYKDLHIHVPGTTPREPEPSQERHHQDVIPIDIPVFPLSLPRPVLSPTTANSTLNITSKSVVLPSDLKQPKSMAEVPPLSIPTSTKSKDSQARDTSLPASQRHRPNSATLPRKIPLMSAADKALERKDYIAKMLAAKSGKMVINHKAIKAPESPGPGAESSMPAPQATVSPQREAETGQSPAALQEPEVKKSEIKDPGQTELIRRKLQALKSNSTKVTSRDSQSGSRLTLEGQGESQSSISYKSELSAMNFEQEKLPPPMSSIKTSQSSSSLQPQILEQSISSNDQEKQLQYTPSNPFFALLGQKSSGLPGLSSPTPTLPGLSQERSQPQFPTVTLNTSQNVALGHAKPFQTDQLVPFRKELSALQASPQVTAAQLPPMALGGNTTSESPSQALTTERPKQLLETRKRATAAEFIDSPPERVKRQMGSKAQMQLVIDVSEDDSETDDDGANRANADSIATEPVINHSNLLKDKITKSIRDLPPLTDFPSRANTQLNSSTSTPPSSQSRNENEPKDLAAKEAQIRLLNQKIAALQQRKAQKSESRAQTPGIAAPALSDEVPFRSSPLKAAESESTAVEDGKDALAASSQQLKLQNDLAAAETAMEQNIEADRHTQSVVLAKAEAERKEAANATTQKEKEYRLLRKAALEAALPKLDSQIRTASSKLENVRKQQNELEAEIQRGSEGRQLIIDELNTLLATLEADKSVRVDPPPSLNLKSQTSGLDAIEQGADDEYSTSGSASNGVVLSSARSSVVSPAKPSTTASPNENYASQLQSSEAGEIMELSSADEGQINSSSGADSCEDIAQAEDDYNPEDYEPRPTNQLSPQSDSANPIRLGSVDVEMADAFSPEPARPASVKTDIANTSAENPTSRRQSTDSSMREEGELSDSGSMNDSNDDLDDYEPPEPVISGTDRAELEIVGSPFSAPPSHKSSISNPTADNSANLKGFPQALVLPDSQIPTSTCTSPVRDPEKDITGAELDVTGNDTAPMNVGLSKLGHFTPYESPLKIFKSYRYHPGYVSGVTEGYRSLTYSHKINPREPLCPRELAGNDCNDSSCSYQHFKDMRLPDDRILQQLSAAREGTTVDEKSAFIEGLKKTLADMRDMKVTDFHSIAAGIVAHRSRVLDDSSRVLTSL